MEKVRRAVIDVGTNSIKLLVADVEDQVVPVWEGSKQTRLGRGFYETHQLQPAAIAQTARAVAEFAAAARERQAKSIRIIATSAVRDALNAQELTREIEQAAGLRVEILSGEQEADLVFQGVATDPAMGHQPLLLLDVGGGSTEFILGHGQVKEFRASFPLGSVRLLETLPHSDPPKLEELHTCRHSVKKFLKAEVRPGLQPVIAKRLKGTKPTVDLVGTGGTAAILARMEARMERFDRARIEATRLTYERIHWHVEHLWSLSLDRRKKIVGLPSNRADVILTGAVIYEAVMDMFDFHSLRISTRGLRFAAVMR